MVPNCGGFTNRFGVPRLVWFIALKASPRIWKRNLSATANSRESARSMVCIPGPYTVLRPEFPKVYAAGTANAAVLNQAWRSEEHTSELQSLRHLVCRLLLEK